MEDTLNDDSEAENGAEDEPYADAHGEPLECRECGEYVAIHYMPHSEYAAGNAGFSVRCACASGPWVSDETVQWFWPPWYAETVRETEKHADEWIEYYLAEGRDSSNWTGGDGDE